MTWHRPEMDPYNNTPLTETVRAAILRTIAAWQDEQCLSVLAYERRILANRIIVAITGTPLPAPDAVELRQEVARLVHGDRAGDFYCYHHDTYPCGPCSRVRPALAASRAPNVQLVDIEEVMSLALTHKTSPDFRAALERLRGNK